MKIVKIIKLWLTIGRGYSIPQTIIAYIFAVVLASKHCSVNYLLSFLGLIGVTIVHLSCNMLDDYFDWQKGAVAQYKELADKGIIAITHKCFYLEQNLTTPKMVLTVALSLDAIASLIGLYIFTKIGVGVIIIAALTALMGFFYSAPPLRLSYRGLGEPVIGIIFGPLLMAGAYITAGANLDKTIVFASIIVGILIANIAHTHAIMDFEADTKVGKKSFPILFKTKDNAILAQLIMYFISYLIMAYGIYTKIFPLATILVFLTLPKAIALFKLMKTADIIKKPWMGAIENWEQIQKEGSEWFMLRFCVSRNIVTDFIIIFAITYYLFG